MGLLVVTYIVCVNDILRIFFEDTKRATRSRKSKKNRQYNGQKKKKKKGQIIIYKTLHRELRLSNTK
jgi:hypothetical protein